MGEKKCKHCATMVPEEALVCPHCRKRLRQSNTTRIVLGGLLLLFLISLFKTSDKTSAPTIPIIPPTASTENKRPEKKVKTTIEIRKEFSKSYEREFLNLGADVYVTTEGQAHTTLRIKHVLVNRPRVHKLANNATSMATMRRLGFKKIIMTDGYDSTWSINVD